MDLALEQSWREIFALAAEAKAAQRREEQIRLLYQTIDREKDQKHKAMEKEEREAKQLEEILATTAQLAAFDQHLDDYDTGTVHALMENREALDRIRDELRRMTDAAYLLPDGRHVFKTADGRQVFDEHGLEMSVKTIDPDAIGDNHPSWETFKAKKAAEAKLVTEQRDLLEFQAKIDDARSQAGKGDMTKNDLDALDADLKASAPPSVRQKLGLTTPDHGETERPNEPLGAQAAVAADPSRRVQPRPAPF